MSAKKIFNQGSIGLVISRTQTKESAGRINFTDAIGEHRQKVQRGVGNMNHYSQQMTFLAKVDNRCGTHANDRKG